MNLDDVTILRAYLGRWAKSNIFVKNIENTFHHRWPTILGLYSRRSARNADQSLLVVACPKHDLDIPFMPIRPTNAPRRKQPSNTQQQLKQLSQTNRPLHSCAQIFNDTQQSTILFVYIYIYINIHLYRFM